MRQAVRSLGWAVSIFWIMLLLFTVTVAYSALQIRPSFGEPSVDCSGGTLTTSFPLALHNGGFYDISMLNITTLAKDYRGSVVTRSTTFIPLISGGGVATIKHNMSLSMDQVSTENLSHLLFTDTELEVEASLELVYAKAFPLEISLNTSMPWGAPFANLTLGEITTGSINLTHFQAFLPLSFENHSFLEMNGTVRIEIVDYLDQVVGAGLTEFDVQSGTPFTTNVEIIVSGNPANVREARLYFQTPLFNYGPTVISLA